jgi:hypothetical protein
MDYDIETEPAADLADGDDLSLAIGLAVELQVQQAVAHAYGDQLRH